MRETAVSTLGRLVLVGAEHGVIVQAFIHGEFTGLRLEVHYAPN